MFWKLFCIYVALYIQVCHVNFLDLFCFFFICLHLCTFTYMQLHMYFQAYTLTFISGLLLADDRAVSRSRNRMLGYMALTCSSLIVTTV